MSDHERSFKLFFGAEGWPGEGYVTPTGQAAYRNLVLPIDASPALKRYGHIDPSGTWRVEGALCSVPESAEGGAWIAVTVNLASLLDALRSDPQHSEPQPIEFESEEDSQNAYKDATRKPSGA